MAEKDAEKKKRRRTAADTDNRGEPGQNLQKTYNPDVRDWEHRKDRIRDTI
jgi:hypothetical protein